eukprot:13305029-Alexandrium_andersonii.AAC.1
MEHARGTRERVIARIARAVLGALPPRCAPARAAVQAHRCLTCCPRDACPRARGDRLSVPACSSLLPSRARAR